MTSVAVALSVFGVLLVIHLEAVDFGGTALAGLMTLATGLAGVSAVFWGLVGRKRSLALIGCVTLVAILASLLIGGVIQKRQMTASQSRGDRISSALCAYHARHGSYPLHLQALVPDFLSGVPPTAMGLIRRFEFEYESRPGDGYELRFVGQAWTGWRRGPTARWVWFD